MRMSLPNTISKETCLETEHKYTAGIFLLLDQTSLMVMQIGQLDTSSGNLSETFPWTRWSLRDSDVC